MRNFASVSIVCAVLVGVGLGIMFSACGGSANAANTTPAIVAGYCQWGSSTPSPHFLTGLGGNVDCGPTQSSVSDSGLPMPSMEALKNLQVLGLAEGDVVTVYVNGNATQITCTLPTGGQPGGTCSDKTHSAPVNAGDLVAVEASTTSPAGNYMQVALEKQ